MRRERKRFGFVIALLALIPSTGCTAQEVPTRASELMGDLARQLLTFWLL
jgi:hypothetical protein